MQLWSSYARFEKDGWEFTLDKCVPPDCGRPDRRRLAELGGKMPGVYENGYFFINHLDSGIRFSFNIYDAIRKWLEEKSTLNPLESDLPSYGSLLFPVVDNRGLFNCSVYIPSGGARNSPTWGRIICVRIVWYGRNLDEIVIRDRTFMTF